MCSSIACLVMRLHFHAVAAFAAADAAAKERAARRYRDTLYASRPIAWARHVG